MSKREGGGIISENRTPSSGQALEIGENKSLYKRFKNLRERQRCSEQRSGTWKNRGGGGVQLFETRSETAVLHSNFYMDNLRKIIVLFIF